MKGRRDGDHYTTVPAGAPFISPASSYWPTGVGVSATRLYNHTAAPECGSISSLSTHVPEDACHQMRNPPAIVYHGLPSCVPDSTRTPFASGYPKFSAV